MSFSLTYQSYGAHAVLISWPSSIDRAIRQDIQNFETKIHNKFSDLVFETVVAYSSLTLFLHHNASVTDLIPQLKILYIEKEILTKDSYAIWKIPVCYEAKFGMDLEALAHTKGYSVSEIVKMHSTPLYEVYFIGFLPGFPYLGGLNPKLVTPRLEIPRTIVPKGSVAIGGNQTGVYPSESPGGWHIIGNTPVSFFEVTNSTPCFLTPGDQLQFMPVTEKEYHQIVDLQRQGNYRIESEVYRD